MPIYVILLANNYTDMLSLFKLLTSFANKDKSKILLRDLLATYNLEAPARLEDYIVKSVKSL